jgi:hypothetical protein
MEAKENVESAWAKLRGLVPKEPAAMSAYEDGEDEVGIDLAGLNEGACASTGDEAAPRGPKEDEDEEPDVCCCCRDPS